MYYMAKRALFLDRDGVINLDKGYVHKIEDFQFINGIFQVCQKLQSLGFLIFIVTNQSGIARNYFSKKDYFRLTKWMVEKFKQHKIDITKVYFSPSHPCSNCPRRKPNPGMILEAQKEYKVDLTQSVLIGDKQSDVLAARRAGIKHYFLIETNGEIDLDQLLVTIL